MTRAPRPPYNPWRDADDRPIKVGCRVRQIGVATEHGALPKNQDKEGVVERMVGAKGYRVYVAFEGSGGDVGRGVRPHMLRVVSDP